jgi:hypothetical protein
LWTKPRFYHVSKPCLPFFAALSYSGNLQLWMWRWPFFGVRKLSGSFPAVEQAYFGMKVKRSTYLNELDVRKPLVASI